MRECCIAVTFVCGAPLCAEHECCNESYGLTGSAGSKHSQRGFDQFKAWSETNGVSQ